MASRGYVSLSSLILRVLRERFALRSGSTIEDIVEGIGQRSSGFVVETWIGVRDPRGEPMWWGALDRRGMRSVVSECLDEFGELGLVRYEADDNGDEGHRWHLLPDWIERGGNGGDGEPPRRDENPPGEDGRGGGGLGEVLAHPRLFALAAEDLDDAVLRALGGGR